MSPGRFRRGLQAGDLPVEVALLLDVGGRPGRGPVRLKRGGTVACHLEEVAADGVEAAIRVDPGVGRKTLAQFEAMVAKGEIHYYVGRGSSSFGGGAGSSAIASWVAAHFTAQTVGGTTVYDLTQPK